MLKTSRRQLLALVGALSIFRPARAQPAGTFTLLPGLAGGQRVSYRQELEVVRNGLMAAQSVARTTLEIVAPAGSGWLARWTTQEHRLIEAGEGLRPIFEALLSLWDGVPVELLLDASGRVIGLADVAVERARLAASLDQLMPLLAPASAPAPLAGFIRAAVRPYFDSEAYITQALLKEPTILMGAMGRDFRVAEPLMVPGRVPSPLGTGEIPTLGRFAVRAVDTARSQAELGWLMAVDRSRLTAQIAAELGLLRAPLAELARDTALPEAGERAGQALATAASQLDFDDSGDFVIDTTSAWPVQVRHRRRIVSGETSRFDATTFTRIDALELFADHMRRRAAN
jgi:hypothetical protein